MLDDNIEPDKDEPFLRKKTAWQEEVEVFQEHIKALKENAWRGFISFK